MRSLRETGSAQIGTQRAQRKRTVVIVECPECNREDLEDVERMEDLVDQQGKGASTDDLDGVPAKEDRPEIRLDVGQSSPQRRERLPAWILPLAAGKERQSSLSQQPTKATYRTILNSPSGWSSSR